MEIKSIKRTKKITRTYNASVIIGGEKYNLLFDSVDGKFDDYKKVRTADLIYFEHSERARKSHYTQILKHINVIK